MDSRQFHLHDGKKGAALAIRVTPRARRNEISGILNDGTVKIRLTSSSDESKTNEALLGFLSEILEVPRSRLEIVAGVAGRDKLVSILDISADMVQERIIKRLSDN
ncbi:MAG: DUF167 domain-containing protein [Anaerolineales bacterium]|nr:DUF167 domain-containing protein [Anaerolineales bacterium]